MSSTSLFMGEIPLRKWKSPDSDLGSEERKTLKEILVYTDYDPDGNEVTAHRVLGRLNYNNGTISNAHRNVLPYIAEFIGIIDQINEGNGENS